MVRNADHKFHKVARSAGFEFILKDEADVPDGIAVVPKRVIDEPVDCVGEIWPSRVVLAGASNGGSAASTSRAAITSARQSGYSTPMRRRG